MAQMPAMTKDITVIGDGELLTYIIQLRKITQGTAIDEGMRNDALLAVGRAYSEANKRKLVIKEYKS